MSGDGKQPVVTEDERRKSLRFDRHYVQSAMYKHAPFELVLSYSRTVMGFLLFQPAPRQVLIIGLGGGSLSKYCYRHLPEATVTTVEIDQRIIALRDEFAIPADDDRFRVVHADGADYIADAPTGVFDAIILDGYGPGGLPGQLSTQDFYDRCADALSGEGVLVANLLQSDSRMGLYVSRIRTAFNDRVVKIRAERCGNQIVNALKCERLPGRRTLRERAAELEARHGINFPGMVKRMVSDPDANRCAF